MFTTTKRHETAQEIMASLKKGDTNALSQLYDEYAAVLLGLITRIVPDKDAAEAILAESFSTIWQQKATYNPESHLLTWMLTIARKVTIAGIKAGKYIPAALATKAPILIGDAETNTNRQYEAKIKEFCCRLTAEEKSALDMIYLKGYSCSEAAAELGMPETEFKASLQRAVKLLGAEKAA